MLTDGWTRAVTVCGGQRLAMDADECLLEAQRDCCFVPLEQFHIFISPVITITVIAMSYSIDNIIAKAQTHETQINGIIIKNDEQDALIKSLTSVVEELQNKLSSFETLIASQRDIINDLTTRIQILENVASSPADDSYATSFYQQQADLITEATPASNPYEIEIPSPESASTAPTVQDDPEEEEDTSEVEESVVKTAASTPAVRVKDPFEQRPKQSKPEAAQKQNDGKEQRGKNKDRKKDRNQQNGGNQNQNNGRKGGNQQNGGNQNNSGKKDRNNGPNQNNGKKGGEQNFNGGKKGGNQNAPKQNAPQKQNAPKQNDSNQNSIKKQEEKREDKPAIPNAGSSFRITGVAKPVNLNEINAKMFATNETSNQPQQPEQPPIQYMQPTPSPYMQALPMQPYPVAMQPYPMGMMVDPFTQQQLMQQQAMMQQQQLMQQQAMQQQQMMQQQAMQQQRQ